MDATTRFWEIPELIILVAEACIEPLGYEYRAGEHRTTRATPSWTKGLGTVHSLALTCQRTFYACIPVLWRVQSSIENLTRCLPPGAWEGQFPPADECSSQLGNSSFVSIYL